MALTTLDPNTALIIVDLQKGIVGSPFVHPIGGVVDRSRALLDAFRERGLPVVLVNVAGGTPGRTERPRHSEPFPAGWTRAVLIDRERALGFSQSGRRLRAHLPRR
jgi:nicotinamidase-related amidase